MTQIIESDLPKPCTPDYFFEMSLIEVSIVDRGLEFSREDEIMILVYVPDSHPCFKLRLTMILQPRDQSLRYLQASAALFGFRFGNCEPAAL